MDFIATGPSQASSFTLFPAFKLLTHSLTKDLAAKLKNVMNFILNQILGK